MHHLYIYHIVTLTNWELQKHNKEYTHPSLQQEGFIHCSTAEQLDATIKRYYASEKKVVVLTIDTTLLAAELKYELASSVNQLFPHIVGMLNLSAVIYAKEVIVSI